jgi:hypothetical protein
MEYKKIEGKNFNEITTSFSPNDEGIVRIKKSYAWSNSNSGSYSESPSQFHTKQQKQQFHTKQQNNFQSRDMLSFRTYIKEDEDKKNDFQEEENLPTSIAGFYIYDYNILKIDEIIKKKFSQDGVKKINKLSNLIELEELKIQERQNLIQRKASLKKIAEYEAEIKKHEDDIDRKIYIERSKPFIEAYNKIGPIKAVVSFLSNNKETISSPETEEQQIYRHKIISNYLEIARKYITIDLVRNLLDVNLCPGCGIDTSKVEMIEDDSDSTICPNCSLEKINIIKSAFYADGGRINNSRNNYEDRANFEKVLLRYQGKQITKPGRELYMKLDEYFISRGLPSSQQYKAMPLLKDGTKEGTSREMMYEALSNIGCSGYYDDINLICSVFFGWTLPDISHLEEDIMTDYDEFQAVFEQLPDREGRKSSLNSQWKLYILLRRRKWPCRFKDFKIPTTISILEYHKIKTKECYQILGWEANF